MLFSKILPINITLWNGIIRTNTESCVTDLDWKSIFKIQKAYLTNIFQFTTCLADLTFLISCITTRSPSKNSKWPCTYLALFVILSPRLHSHRHNINACTQTIRIPLFHI
ncbi:CCCH-type zinc fingerfamily protein with RNA-binding domain-containing protein [Trifolium repens]|nr:CCCH-type zinc fingerfamily protein with RNA-binding domain-containing protein [Trifolium repens]